MICDGICFCLLEKTAIDYFSTCGISFWVELWLKAAKFIDKILIFELKVINYNLHDCGSKGSWDVKFYSRLAVFYFHVSVKFDLSNCIKGKKGL